MYPKLHLSSMYEVTDIILMDFHIARCINWYFLKLFVSILNRFLFTDLKHMLHLSHFLYEYTPCLCISSIEEKCKGENKINI